MLTIPSLTQVQFMQSFNVDPEMQKYPTVRVPIESEYDFDLNTKWKNDSITSKIFLVYLSGTSLCFLKILLEKFKIFLKYILKFTLKVTKGTFLYYVM